MAGKEKTTETVSETISKIMADVKAVEKNSSNFGLKFKFQGIEDIINSLHGVFAKHGLHIRPTSIDYQQSDMSTGKGLNTRLVGTITYELTNRGGDSVQAVVLSEGQDPGDKATGKFMSYGYKALLKQVFMIPTNDPDPDTIAVANQTTPFIPATTEQVEFIKAHIPPQQQPSVAVWATKTIGKRHVQDATIDQLSTREAEAIIQQIKTKRQQTGEPA